MTGIMQGSTGANRGNSAKLAYQMHTKKAQALIPRIRCKYVIPEFASKNAKKKSVSNNSAVPTEGSPKNHIKSIAGTSDDIATGKKFLSVFPSDRHCLKLWHT